jgi:(E)-4-hydroxy-3-methyl-but-2-enyl pyrophosphate reductase
MKISIAKSSGFCMGVRRAVEMVLDASMKHEKPICTYGPLIHNPQVLKLLKEKGIRILDKTPDTGAGIVLIRAHGVPPQTKEKLINAGFDMLDATCPRVIRIQTIIKKYAEQGYASIIIGDKKHPEVVGLQGYAGERGYVVGSVDELDDLPMFDKAVIVAQTTQNTYLFQAIKEWAGFKYPHYKIFDTICGSTERRQAEVKRLADTVDAVLVVGGRNSGNTRRLVDVSKQTGKPTFHIETEADLDYIDQDKLSSYSIIGITAGASTPNWIIKKVYKALEELPHKRRQGWRSILFSVQRSLLLTNIYLSIGAGLLCYACIKLQRLESHMPYIFLSMFYVQSMHVLNHLTGGKADKYNDPERASFYRKNKYLLTFLSIFSASAGLGIAFIIGVWPFTIVLAMSIMGLSYNLKLVPQNFFRSTYRRIKDIPGSKTILIAIAWGILTALLPSVATTGAINWSNWLIFFWASGLVFVRTSFFDILDMQGDRLVAKETLALLLGEKRSLRLLNIVLMLLIVTLPIGSAIQFVSPLGFALTLCPIFIWMVLLAYKNGYLLPGVRLEFLVETLFMVAGLITFIWSAVA